MPEKKWDNCKNSVGTGQGGWYGCEDLTVIEQYCPQSMLVKTIDERTRVAGVLGENPKVKLNPEKHCKKCKLHEFKKNGKNGKKKSKKGGGI